MTGRAITVGYLYPEIMSGYGDRGNLAAITRRCGWRGIAADVRELRLGDPVDPGEVDLFVIGNGGEFHQRLIATDLADVKGPGICEAVDDGAALLAVGAGYELLGRFYQPARGVELPGARLFDTWTIQQGADLTSASCTLTEARAGRAIGDLLVQWDAELLVGFENHSARTYLGPTARPLGQRRRRAGEQRRRRRGCPPRQRDRDLPSRPVPAAEPGAHRLPDPRCAAAPLRRGRARSAARPARARRPGRRRGAASGKPAGPEPVGAGHTFRPLRSGRGWPLNAARFSPGATSAARNTRRPDYVCAGRLTCELSVKATRIENRDESTVQHTAGDMDDKQILGHIDELIKTEHELRAKLAAGELSTDQEHAQLKAAEEALDQCWDLLRQRRARREFNEDAGDSAARPASEVEGYLQ